MAETSKSARGRDQWPTEYKRGREGKREKKREKQKRIRIRMTKKRRRMDEKETTTPRVTTFERPTRRYTSRPVRVYQPSPSANRAVETWMSSSRSTLPSSQRTISKRKKWSVFPFQSTGRYRYRSKYRSKAIIGD